MIFLLPSLKRVAWLGLAVAACACAHATPGAKARATRRSPAYHARLSDALAARLSQGPHLPHVGVWVATVDDHRPLLAHNADDPFVPASTTKVLTASAALESLGPQYRFETQLWADGVDEKRHTARNLYLRGSGDPSFAVADLVNFVVALKQTGISQITGEIVIDDTAFDAVPWARGWMWDDLSAGFSAPISAVNVTGNSLRLRLRPGRRGEPVKVTHTPHTRFVSVSSEAITVAQSAPHQLKIGDGTEAMIIDGPPVPADAFSLAPEAGRALSDVALSAGQRVVLSGTMAESAGPQDKELAVRNPAAWASVLLREQMALYGVTPPPSWRRGQVPPLATLVASHSSEELGALLFDALKTSNNHTMECVLKRMGTDASLQPGTFAAGAQVVRRYVASLLTLRGGQEPLLWDGSGLSRYNLITPAVLGGTMRAAAKSFAMGAELAAGLPISGLDGTLAHRQRGPLRGRVRAKTGTMTGVSALTGLLATNDGDVLAFAIMMDHYLGSSEQARLLQDDILAILDAPP